MIASFSEPSQEPKARDPNSCNMSIEVLMALYGFDYDQFFNESLKQMIGVDISKLNFVHWVLFFNRKDLLHLILQKYF